MIFCFLLANLYSVINKVTTYYVLLCIVFFWIHSVMKVLVLCFCWSVMILSSVVFSSVCSSLKSLFTFMFCFDLSWILFNIFQAFLHTKRLECPLCHLQWRRFVPFWSLWKHHNNLNWLFSGKWLFTGMQGNIARWLKKEGDKVAPGEVLCEVETVGSLFRPLVEVQLLIKIWAMFFTHYGKLTVFF